MFKSSGFGFRQVVTPEIPTLRQRICALSVSSPLTSVLGQVREAITDSSPSDAVGALAIGLQPLADLPQAMAEVSQELGHIKGGIATLVQLMQHKPRQLSELAFRALARLGQVRDALCDQTPSPKGVGNTRLSKELGAKHTRQLLEEIRAKDADLARAFERQFLPLGDDIVDTSGASEERRERLIELMTVEWQVVDRLADPAQPPVTTTA